MLSCSLIGLTARPWPRGGVRMGGCFLGGLNQVFRQFRWRGTERLFSAQFNMIGLTPRPEPFPFHHGPYNNRRAAVCPSRCAPGEERCTHKETTTSVQFSRSAVSDSLRPHGLQHARPPCPSPAPGTCSNSCPWSRRCHPTTLSSVIPFSSCIPSFPASGSFPVIHHFGSGG